MLRSYIFPQTLARLSTTYNHDIRVIEEMGTMKLLVNGSPQSGQYVEMLWKKAFSAFGTGKAKQVNRILMIGVGGGTAIRLLSKQFPSAFIDAVDIDSTVLDISRMYFHLDQITNLSLIQNDGSAFVKKAGKAKTRYDIIVIDVFIGRFVPEFVEKPEFISSLKSILSPHGLLIINYLREFEYLEKSREFLAVLQKQFANVADFQIKSNRFFLCSQVPFRSKT